MSRSAACSSRLIPVKAASKPAWSALSGCGASSLPAGVDDGSWGADPKVKARLTDRGSTVHPGTPADFAKFVGDETEKWGKVIRTR